MALSAVAPMVRFARQNIESMNRLNAFQSQLDGLVVFLAAARSEVFELIHSNELTWFPHTQDPRAAETLEAYQTAVSNSAFLLGYAYLEAFLADIVRQAYRRRPRMLPAEKQVSYREVVAASSMDALLNRLTDREVRSVFAGSIEDVRKHFTEKLGVKWPNEPTIALAARIRNCLMHNDGRADERLVEFDASFSVEQRICLRPDQVHGYGLRARHFAAALWEDVMKRHLGSDAEIG